MNAHRASGAGSSPPSEASDRDTVESAREVVRALVKALKAYKIYLPEHAFRRRFREDLHARFQRHLDAYGELVLTVKTYELWCGSSAVYEEPNRFENLAFRCSADGLCTLTFHRGLSLEDLEAFIEVLASEARPLDEDIVTRLWERGVPHITYVVVDDAGGSEADAPGLSSPTRGLDRAVEAVPAPTTEWDEADEIDAPAPAQDGSKREVYTLSEDDVQTLRRDVVEDTRQDHVDQLVDILVSILSLDDDEHSFLEVLQILDEMVMASLRQGRHRQATELLRRLVALAEPTSHLSERSRALIRVVWTEFGGWERVAPLEEALNQRGLWDGEGLTAYLRFLPPSSVPALMTLLERVQTAKGRRIICDALVVLARTEIDTLIQRLPSAPWYLARNLICVLGCLGDEKALPALVATMEHPEVRIRTSALKAMEAIGGPRVAELMPRWLGDGDEAVRLLAMKAARHAPSARVLEALSAMIMDKRFVRRSEAEQQEAFDALADIGGDAILPLFGTLVSGKRTWPWISSDARERRGRCAVAAARWIGTAAAAAFLRDAAARGGVAVRAEAVRALRDLDRAAHRGETR